MTGPIAKHAIICCQPPDGRLCLLIVTAGEQRMAFALTRTALRGLRATVEEPLTGDARAAVIAALVQGDEAVVEGGAAGG
jgi:hypothetical protein